MIHWHSYCGRFEDEIIDKLSAIDDLYCTSEVVSWLLKLVVLTAKNTQKML